MSLAHSLADSLCMVHVPCVLQKVTPEGRNEQNDADVSKVMADGADTIKVEEFNEKFVGSHPCYGLQDVAF